MCERDLNKNGLSKQDVKIIEGCIKNDNYSKTLFFNKYKQLLYTKVYSYLKNNADIDDLIQNIFLRIYKNLHTYSHKGNFEGFISVIAKNMSIDYLRKKKKEKTIIDDDIVIAVSNYNEYMDYEIPNETKKVERILTEMAKLPPQYQLVFKMYFLRSMTHKEISEELGIAVGTSKSNLAKAKEKIKMNLKI